MTTNFDLRVRADGESNRYAVEVIGSPAGESAAIPRDPPVFSAEHLAAWQASQLSNDEAQLFGKALYDWLFPAPLIDRLVASSSRLESQGAMLRIRLRIEPPELSRLPWELCWNIADEFMALRPDLAWVRYISEPFAPGGLGTPAPIRVVIALASPSDLPPLDTDGEAALIRDSLQKVEAGVQVKVIPHTTWDLIHDALVEGADVVHFVGHGSIDENGEGYLAFEDDHGDLDAVTAKRLRVLFRGREVKIVVLNACQSAIASGQEAIMAVAPSLVRSGIPAVVAQQAPVPDRLAKTYAKTFYEQLAKGKPLDEIITEMRIRAYGRAGNVAHWGIPVLFMRAPDGTIWQGSSSTAEENIPASPKTGVNISGINNSQINIGTVAGRDIVSSSPVDDDLRKEGDAEE